MRNNNFDLIRLLAAFQVVYGHCIHHFKIQNSFLKNIHEYFLMYFPGVPIFFFVSGFLIWGAYERSQSNIMLFFINRFLRIFPALLICSSFLFIILLVDLYTTKLSASMFIWFLGQITVFQFYTPSDLRVWGVGTPNGSLWTISVEIQFYIIVPIIFYFYNKIKNRKLFFMLTMFLLSVLFNFYIGKLDQNSLASKLLGVFIFPYLYYFLFGIFAYKYFDTIISWIKGKALYYFIIYCLFVLFVGIVLKFNIISYTVISPLNVLATLLLCMFIFSAAYSATNLSTNILKSNDISYGVYLYHMVFVNLFVHRGLINLNSFLYVFILTIIFSIISWFMIEKNALKLKYKLNKI